MYIENILAEEINYFEKKYSYKIEFITGPDLIIPEYKIELLNKNKKIINIIENIHKIEGIKKRETSKTKPKNKKSITLVKKIDKEKLKKKKIKKKQIRTLWVRRKKAV